MRMRNATAEQEISEEKHLMRKLTENDIATCKFLGEQHADEDVDGFIAWENREKNLSSDDVIALLWDDWGSFSQSAVYDLVKNRLMDEPSVDDFNFRFEKLLAFTLFTKAYEKRMLFLIKDRFKVYLRVPFQEKDIVKALGAKWDTASKRWYLSEGLDPGPFSKWIETPAPKATHFTVHKDEHGRWVRKPGSLAPLFAQELWLKSHPLDTI